MPTSILLHVKTEVGRPATLEIVVSGARGELGRSVISGRGSPVAIPGSVVVLLDDDVGVVSAVAVGRSSQGIEQGRGATLAPVRVPARRQVEVTVVLRGGGSGGPDAGNAGPEGGGADLRPGDAAASDAGPDQPTTGDGRAADAGAFADAEAGSDADPARDAAVDPAVDPPLDPAIDPAVDPAVDPAIDAAVPPDLAPDLPSDPAIDPAPPMMDAAMDTMALPPPECRDPGIMACYLLDENAGAAIADSSGNGNDGIASNTTWTAGVSGSALAFAGSTTGEVVIPRSPSLAAMSAVTMEAWVSPSAVGTDGTLDRIIDKAMNAGYGLGLGAAPAAAFGRVCAKVVDSSTTCGATEVPTGGWSHVAATWDGATVSVYLNGQLDGSKARGGSIPASSVDLRLGNRSDGAGAASYWFRGAMDVVRIYNRAKTPAEICAAAGRTWSPATARCS